jgi:putative hydrolase of the HAD superfamily
MRAPLPDVVLFDLGGVLIDLGGVEPMQRLAGIDHPEEVWSRWLACPWVRRYERGLCRTDEFARGMIEDWRLPLEPDAFLELFAAWPLGLHAGAADLVRETAARARVGCLSNTNALHWERASAWGLEDLFETRFLSHELGKIKPDPEMFEHAVGALGVPAGRVLFLDDNRINVEGARRAGLRARRVGGVREARSALEDAGLLGRGSGPGSLGA